MNPALTWNEATPPTGFSVMLETKELYAVDTVLSGQVPPTLSSSVCKTIDQYWFPTPCVTVVFSDENT